MSPIVRKEFRGLMLPLALTLVATLIIPLEILPSESWAKLLPGWAKQVAGFLFGLSPVLFFGGVIAMAAGTFGVEFQHKTTALWFSQPASRARLWRDKMLVLATALIISILAAVIALVVMQQLTGIQLILEKDSDKEVFIEGVLGAAVFIFATACSGCYWTLLARSTLGGIVFSLGSQFALAAGVYVAAERLFGDNARLNLAAIGVAGVLYAIMFLLLGWRKFVRYELRDSTPGRGGFQLDSLTELISRRWLPNAPRNKFLNLLRKELGLSLPLFVIAAVFSTCWLLSLAAFWLMPTRRSNFEIVFTVLVAVYLPVMTVLSGSVSVIEEKSLGTHAWQLTLPLAAWRQWFMKLVTALCLGGIFTLLLPLLMWLITAPLFGAKGEGVLDGWQGIVMFWAACCAFSFWSATLVSTSSRAALTAALGLCCISSCVYIGIWCAQELKGPQGEFAGWLQLLRLGALVRNLPNVLMILAFVGPALGTVLLQSLVQFRRAQTPPLTLWKYSLILSAVIFLTAFFCGG